MAVTAVRNKIDARRRERVGFDPGRVHALARPERAQRFAESVVAQAGQIGCARARAGRGNGAIARVSAETLAVDGAIWPGLVELDHRLAQGDNIKTFGRHWASALA